MADDNGKPDISMTQDMKIAQNFIKGMINSDGKNILNNITILRAFR